MRSISSLNVVMCQIDVLFGKPEENLANVTKKLANIDFIKENYLIVLPELFATGYDLQAIKKSADSLETSKIVDFCKKLAKEKESFLYASVPEKFNSKIFNTAIFLDPQGSIKAVYRKIHLFKPLQEHIVFSPGKKVSTYDSDIGKIGFSICYDLRFGELYVNQRNAGCKILLICAEWPIPRIQHWVTLLKARAIEHQALVIGLNRVGEDSTGVYGGNSVIIAPDGSTIFQGLETEEVSTTVINLEKILNMSFLFNIKEEKQIS